MTTGTRMKNRRKELGITVDEIASALGVSVATVYRYENGEIEKVPGSVLEPLAKVLRTTPAYLMGWEDVDAGQSPIPESEDAPPIENPDIRMIARAGRKMTPEQAENVRKYAEFMFPEAFKDDDT